MPISEPVSTSASHGGRWSGIGIARIGRRWGRITIAVEPPERPRGVLAPERLVVTRGRLERGDLRIEGSLP
jgi:hypothetical protein